MEARPGTEAQLLGDVLGCPVTVTDDPAASLAEVERRHCFDPTLQRGLTAAYLGDLVAGLGSGVVHELREPLGIRLTLARLGQALLLIGPYTDRALTSGEAAALLGGLRIQGSHLPSYQLYRARYAIVDSEYALRGAAGMLKVAGVPYDEAQFEQVMVVPGPVSPGAGERWTHSASFAEIEARYEHEHEFMRAISVGDERSAVAALQRMASSMARQPAYLSTPYLGQTILRILTRVGAQLGGLPPVTIDAISQTYAQRLHRTAHSASSRSTSESIAMVTEFCRHVRRHRQRTYSRLVRQVVDEVELHLSHHVSPRELAGRLKVSESHLARTFKKETGQTIAEHVAQVRAERAAQLLAATNQPVRDIAAFVGYLDANYFVKVFRSVYGMTPTAYRRQHTV